MITPRTLLLMLLLLLALPMAAQAGPLPVSAPQTRPVGLFPVAAEIGQQIQALVTGDENAEIEPQETFGTRALGLILTSIKLFASESAAFVDNFTAFPQFATWYAQQINDPALADRWTQTGKLLLFVIAGAFAAGWLADLVLLPLRRRVSRRDYVSSFSRFGGVFSWLLLSLIPVIVFIATALFVIDNADPPKLARFIVMTIVYALAILRLVRLFLRFLLAPRVPALRLMPISTPQALYVNAWLSWYSALAIFGYFIADVAHVVKVPAAVLSGFRSSVALVIVIMTIVVILQKRSFVSTYIRGDLSAAKARQSLWNNLRLWSARSWHIWAIGYLVIGYFVTMLGSGGGFLSMQQGTVGTLLSLVMMRLIFYVINRMSYEEKREGEPISGIYRPVLRLLAKIVVWVLGVAGVAASWDVEVVAIATSAWGQRVLGSVFSITSTLLIVVFVYELLNRMIERKLNYTDADGHIQANARARTLLPMVKKAAIGILGVIVTLVTLSEFGINIAPLLAGAGVLGVAIGFGSQTLVKDFLTGLFIILEDNLAVGDSVIIGGNKGVVENLSIRTVRLRDVNGSLHIMPFSELTTITNESKVFAFALMDIGVSYDSNLEHVIGVIKSAGEAMRVDPAYSDMILDDIEVMGVESLGDSAVVIRSRIKTNAGKQGDVRRGFLLRIKNAFDTEGIEIPFPHVVQVKRPEKAEK